MFSVLFKRVRINCSQICIRRRIYSKTGIWPVTCTYDFKNICVISFLKQVEEHWKPIIRQVWRKRSETRKHENTRYILSMFPYPSGSLHLGHVRIYTMADIISKYNQLCGYDVLNPMGWDSYGLPAENAAIERSLNPKNWTEQNISRMREQFDSIALDFDWREATSDPSFYRWTQWLFLQLFNSKLAYKSFAKVNWDPVDCTVLANEQVDDEGKSWRSGAKVEKRYLRQWFIKTSAFLEALYNGDDAIFSAKGLHWRAVVERQREWIGELNTFVFYIKHNNEDLLPVLCDSPELFFSPNSFIAVSSDHWLKNGDEVQNPFNGKLLPVKVMNTDKNVAEAVLMCDTPFDSSELREKVLHMCKNNSELGGFRTSYKFRDWVVSRQRYWGTPIPFVNCDNCGIQPIPENKLPVFLPEIENLQSVTSSCKEVVNRLQAVAPEHWLKTKCPKCSHDCVRDTETLDTLFDSSWYYLRYATEPNENVPFCVESTKNPVWLYLGGVEHMCGHLLFARFVYHFLRRNGNILSQACEPFNAIFLQSVVAGKTYIVDGKYIPNSEVKQLLAENKVTEKDITVKFEKMSKSKGNGVDPLTLVEKYGIDATRISVVGFTKSEKTKFWNGDEEEFFHTFAFIKNVVLTVDQFIFIRLLMNQNAVSPVIKRFTVVKIDSEQKINEKIQNLRKERNKFVNLVSTCNENIIDSGGVVSRLHHFLNNVIRSVVLSDRIALSVEYERCLADLIIALSPVAPHLAEECWQGFTKYANPKLNDFYDLTKLVCEQKWLQLDADYEPEISEYPQFDASEPNIKRKKKKQLRKKTTVVQSQVS